MCVRVCMCVCVGGGLSLITYSFYSVFPPKGGTRVLPPLSPNLVFFDVVIGMFNLL